MITMKISGYERVKANLFRVSNAVQMGMYEGLKASTAILKVNADSILTNKTKGQSEVRLNESIHNNWVREDPKREGRGLVAILINKSAHAGFVEVGTTDRIYPQGGGPMGPFLYKGEMMRRWVVRGQPPKAYLRGAINTSGDLILKTLHREINTRMMGAVR